MNVQSAITTIKNRINDLTGTGYTTAIIIDYLNDAINYVSSKMVEVNHPLLLRDISVTNAMVVPDNFVKFAGTYPIRRTGQILSIIDGSETVDAKYYRSLDNVVLNGDMPLNDPIYTSLIIQVTCIYALNKNEFDTSQDAGLVQELEKTISTVLGGAT